MADPSDAEVSSLEAAAISDGLTNNAIALPRTACRMDIGSIASMQNLTHLPVCADPSHPAGRRELVESLALASVAAGADMLEIEVHRDPDNALSDSTQQLTVEMFERVVKNVRKIEEIVRG